MERHGGFRLARRAPSAVALASALTISLSPSFPLPPPEPGPVRASPRHGPRPGERRLADLPVVSALSGAGVTKIVSTWGNRKDIFHII